MGLVVGDHVHDYTSSEMKTPQSRNWGKQVYHKIIPHWRVNYGSAMKWIQKHCVVNCLFVYIYRLSLHRSVVHNENMLQNKCSKQTMYASYINLQPLAVSRMAASRLSTGLLLMAFQCVHLYFMLWSCFSQDGCRMDKANTTAKAGDWCS